MLIDHFLYGERERTLLSYGVVVGFVAGEGTAGLRGRSADLIGGVGENTCVGIVRDLLTISSCRIRYRLEVAV